MASFGVRPLDDAAWPDFAELVERHRGVSGRLLVYGLPPRGCGAPQDSGAEPGREGVPGP